MVVFLSSLYSSLVLSGSVVVRVEKETQLADTVKAIEICDTEILKLNESIDENRVKVGKLEAEADAEKTRDLRATVIDIMKAMLRLRKVAHSGGEGAWQLSKDLLLFVFCS